MKETIRFTINRKPVIVQVEGDRALLWVVRTELGLTGTKFGCGSGFCGACTVLVDDRAVRSCQVPVREVQGKKVVTIEGLAANGELHPIQKAFMEHEALQCGFCTPGMILTACDLLRRNPNPSRAEIIEHLDQNLCRCGTHTRVIDAVVSAAKEMR